MVTAIILGAGSGSRSKLSLNKVLFKVNGKTLLNHCLDTFLECHFITNFIVTCKEEELFAFSSATSNYTNLKLVLGGKSRGESVFNALREIEALNSSDIVLVHDGARPFVSKQDIENCFNSVHKNGSGICGVKSVDTVYKTDKNGKIVEYLNRDELVNIQTPQGFFYKDIFKAYSLANENSRLDSFTDDSAVYCEYIDKANISAGSYSNIKLTNKEDFEKIGGDMNLRIGHGQDSHNFGKFRDLVLGGVNIPYEFGLLGHSDADVLTHAIMDSVLACASLRDIGFYFSDKKEEFKDISSLVLLKKVKELVVENNTRILSISAVIQAENPKLSPYIELMKEKIAEVLEIEANTISITCTTLEGKGYIGRGEGIFVSAVTLSCVQHSR